MKQDTGTVDGQVGVKGDEVDTVIIGAGQCGLSTGYYLSKQSRSFVILDENERVGDNWRRRYDSLRLYTPSRYNGLPGMAFPGSRSAFPSGQELADYLQEYAARFDLPVRGSTIVERVERLSSAEGGFLVTTNTGTVRAANVVVATGPQHLPHVPDFAGELDPEIRQFHSSDYRNQSQLQPGPVLVVGASHSGADLAMECAPDHPTWLVGRDTGQIPINIEGRLARGVLPVLWFVANHVLTVRNPAGSKLQHELRTEGGPLLRYKNEDLDAAHVHRTESRLAGVREGQPVLDDGTVLDVTNVLWCTGFRRDFSWIDLPILDDSGWPRAERGVSSDVDGLYFVGLIFQFSFASMLVGGAGRDAHHVARQIARREVLVRT
jgi:putative flavoprotein involved in K+ transport